VRGFNGNYYDQPLRYRPILLGRFGVVVFFVLSGYLIFRPFARRQLVGGWPVRLQSYATNRALRILPLYYVAVIVLLFTTLPGGPKGEEVWRSLLFAQYYSSTIRVVDGPLWSLVCEVQFYILLPLMAFVLLRAAKGEVRRALVVLTVWLLAMYEVYVFTPSSAPPWQFSLPGNMVNFAAGMLLCVVEMRWRDTLERGSVQLALAVAAAGAWIAVFLHPSNEGALLAAVLVVALAIARPYPRSKLGGHRLFRLGTSLGLASYSLYVWHVPVIEELARLHLLPSKSLWLAFVVAVPVCCVVAWVSYNLIERPFMSLRPVNRKAA